MKCGPKNKEWPSRAASIACTAIMPSPPGLLSINTGCFHRAESFSLQMRAAKSGAEPGAPKVVTRTGLAGHTGAWAYAGLQTATPMAPKIVASASRLLTGDWAAGFVLHISMAISPEQKLVVST